MTIARIAVHALAAAPLLFPVACGPSQGPIIQVGIALASTAGQSIDMSPSEVTRIPLPPRTPVPSGVRPDGSSVDAIVKALYASVSHGPEYEPAWDRMHALFLSAAIVIPPKAPDADTFPMLDVDAFIERVRKYIAGRKARGEQLGFTEREIARREHRFGHICQVFSSYETVRAPSDPEPFARGVHSIQLVDDGRRWWIAALVWDTERADNPIPPELLNPKPSPTGDIR